MSQDWRAVKMLQLKKDITFLYICNGNFEEIFYVQNAVLAKRKLAHIISVRAGAVIE
jgi:hypothetical protein